MSRKKKVIHLPSPGTLVVEISTLADVNMLMNAQIPYMRLYPEAFTSSLSVRNEMSVLEQISYVWLLFYSFQEEIQCFMPYTMSKLHSACDVTQARFLKMWNNILSKKFKFAQHNGQIYIYNPRQLKEWQIAKNIRKSGSKGGKQRAINAGQHLNGKHLHLFKDSPYFDKRIFMEALKSDADFANVDHGHYYEKVKAWSQHNKRGNWLDQGRVFILNSAEKNKLKLKTGLPAAQRKNIQTSMINKRKDFKIN